jgi:hypothetical protein
MLSPCFHGIAHLLSEPAHGKRHALAFDQPVVEPGRPRRRDLAIEVDVRPVGENKGRPAIVRTTEPAHLDDAASGWVLALVFGQTQEYEITHRAAHL